MAVVLGSTKTADCTLLPLFWVKPPHNARLATREKRRGERARREKREIEVSYGVK